MTPFLYQCSTCGRLYQRDEVRYLCPDCAKDYRPGIPLVGVLLAQFDYVAIRKRFKKLNQTGAYSPPSRTSTIPLTRSATRLSFRPRPGQGVRIQECLAQE